MPEPQWKLKVEQLMACNCNWGCPCSFDAPPTYGKCETALAYRIAKGKYGGVTLDGLKFILVAAWPKAIHLGHGRGVLFLDAQATGPKREALEAIATAKAGGPMNIYMSMMTEPPEVRTARIEFRFIGKRSRFRIGNRVRVEFEPMRNPVTGEDHFLIGQLPTGLFTKSEEFFSAKNFRVAVNNRYVLCVCPMFERASASQPSGGRKCTRNRATKGNVMIPVSSISIRSPSRRITLRVRSRTRLKSGSLSRNSVHHA